MNYYLKGKSYLGFSTSEELRLQVFECLGKDNKCRDIIRCILDVGCMYGKATFIKVNQLKYDSLSQKYQGISVQVLIALNGIVFLLVKLKSFSYLQSST